MPRLLWVSLAVALTAALLAVSRVGAPPASGVDDSAWRQALVPLWLWSTERLVGFMILNLGLTAKIPLTFSPGRLSSRQTYRMAQAPVNNPWPATKAQAAVVAGLLDAFNQEFDTPTPGPAVPATRLRQILAGGTVFALLTGEPAVGVALVTLRPNIWYDGPVALLDELYVGFPTRCEARRSAPGRRRRPRAGPAAR